MNATSATDNNKHKEMIHVAHIFAHLDIQKRSHEL